MSYLLICPISYGLMALVYVLFLGLRDLRSRDSCRSGVDALCLLSTGHILRILIPLEEPPHLTADYNFWFQLFLYFCNSDKVSEFRKSNSDKSRRIYFCWPKITTFLKIKLLVSKRIWFCQTKYKVSEIRQTVRQVLSGIQTISLPALYRSVDLVCGSIHRSAFQSHGSKMDCSLGIKHGFH